MDDCRRTSLRHFISRHRSRAPFTALLPLTLDMSDLNVNEQKANDYPAFIIGHPVCGDRKCVRRTPHLTIDLRIRSWLRGT